MASKPNQSMLDGLDMTNVILKEIVEDLVEYVLEEEPSGAPTRPLDAVDSLGKGESRQTPDALLRLLRRPVCLPVF